MASHLAANWWAMALRGLLAIVFGVLLFIWPLAGLGALVLLFGAYALVDGVLALVSALRSFGQNDRWWVLLLEGIAGIAAGVVAFVWPGITALVLLYLIAAWAIVTGIFEIIAAVQLREEIENEWLLALGGVASVLFGLFLMVWPGAGALTVVWVVGAYAVLFGIVLLLLGFRLRGMADGARRPIEA